MLVPMARIDVIAPRERADSVLRAVHRLGSVHLVPFIEDSGATAAVFGLTPNSLAEREAAAALAEASELARLLDVGDPPGDVLAELWALDEAGLAAPIGHLGTLRARVGLLEAERARIDGEAARLDGYRSLIRGLTAVVGHLPILRGYESTAIVLDARYRPLIPLVRDELERVTDGRCEVIAGELEGGRLAAVLVYPGRMAAEVRSLLGARDLEEVSLPETLAGLPFDELLPRMDAERERLAEAAARSDAEMTALQAADGPFVAAMQRVLSDRLAELRALASAGLSDHLVILSGWIPASRVADLRAALATEHGEEVLVTERPPARGEAATAPVAFEERRVIRAFQPLVSFISTPRYGTVDPTPLLAITFPVFVGMMVGDVAYGLILLAALALARRRYGTHPAFAILWPIGVLAAISTMAFGVLYGEWFGDAGHEIAGLQPLWVDRREAVIPMLVLALAIGFGQVAFGLVLGIINARLLRHTHEVLARAALLACLAASLGLIAWMANLVPDSIAHLAVVTIVGSILVLIVSVGVSGPLELMGVFGNVLSYARLMAIGLSSVMLALVANRLGDLSGNLVVGLLIAGVLHALNIGLGFFDSSIQGLRLHYVEFFSKFLEPGGVPYAPFRAAISRPGGIVRPASGGT